MQFINRHFQTNGFIEVKLDQKTIEYLWKIVNKGLKKKLSHKKELAGNISKSYLIFDDNNYFFKRICEPLINIYRENNNNGLDPSIANTTFSENTKLILKDFWVNYQYQTEFNPYHNHGGVYSFAIWMKIPYSCEEQALLPQFKEIDYSQRKAGGFEFEFLDTLGETKQFMYQLSPSYEGSMVFFPSRLRHCVYPFYGTEETRVSISGNIWFDSFLGTEEKANKGFA